MKEGKELIRYFCVPCKPTKANGGRTRNLRLHPLIPKPAFALRHGVGILQARQFIGAFRHHFLMEPLTGNGLFHYVDVEKSIRRKLHNFPIPESEMELYRLDQRINDRGVLVDMGLASRVPFHPSRRSSP